MQGTNTAEQEEDNTVPLHLHAMDNISYIRETMSRSTEFTNVPGWGMVIVGLLATFASYIATLHRTTSWWFDTWIVIGLVSMAIGVVAMKIKAYRNDTQIFTLPGRRFLLCFTPTIVAGMAVTDLLYWQGGEHLLPALWLLIYGLAVLTAGAHSNPIVPFLGLTLFVLGIVTMQLPYLFVPIIGVYTYADICMVAGFGLCHIIFGLIIAVRHGG